MRFTSFYSILFTVVLAGLIVGGAGGCRATSANIALNLMSAKSYYDDPTQIRFIEAIGGSDVARMRKWLEAGGDVNALGKKHMHPLYWAMGKRSLEGFEFLLKNGSDPGLARLGEGGMTLYRVAAGANDVRFLRLLLKNGMDANQSIEFAGNTVLYDAIRSGRMENVEILVEDGANLDHQNDSGKTPMLSAASFKNYHMVYYFLKQGADPKIENMWGYDLAGVVDRYRDRGMKPGSVYHENYLKVVDELERRGLLP